MAPSKWNDEKIISTLKDMPKVEDSRTKEELFQNISNQIEMEQASNHQQEEKRHFRFLPTLATVAVFAIILLIIPPIFQDGVEMNSKHNADESNLQPKMFSTMEKRQENQYIGSLQQIPENKEIITMYYPDQALRFLVPLTFLVNKEAKPKFEQVKDIINVFDARNYGLEKSFLHEVALTETDDPKTVIADIPKGYLQEISSGTARENLLMETINRTLADFGYEKVSFMTEGKVGIELPHMGHIEEAPVQSFETIGYVPFTTATGNILLYSPEFPSETMDVSNVPEVLQSDEAGLSATPILSNANYSFKEIDEDKLLVQFEKDTKLKDNSENYALIDSILLTANKFGFKEISFKGLSTKEIGPYMLDAPVSIPKGPNYIKLELPYESMLDESIVTGGNMPDNSPTAQILLNPLAINKVTTGDSYNKVLEQFDDPIKFDDNKSGLRLLYYSKKGAGIKVEVDVKSEVLQSLTIYPEFLDENFYTAVPRQKADIIETFGQPSESNHLMLKYYQKDPKKTMEVKLASDGETVESIKITDAKS